jgi:hypothetical protein
MPRQIPLLARHFFWRFFDNDLVSPESDAHEAASLAIAFLATPGILRSAILFLRYGSPWLPPPERLVMALGDKLQLISWSMTVMALAAIVVWDALVLDARDYAILGPLPIARHTLLEGKLLAVTLFVGVFALAVNAVPMLLYPLAFLSSSHLSFAVGFWVMIGLAVATLAAAAFGFLAVLGIRGLLLNLFGPKLFGRVSLPAQFVMALFVLTGLSNVSVATLQQGGSRLYLWPPLWFLGLAETIADRGILATLSPAMQRLYGLVDLNAQRATVLLPGSRAYTGGQEYVANWPMLQHLALIAAVGLAACAIAASLLYFVSHFRHASHLRQAATSQPGGRHVVRDILAWVARRVIVRDPIAQASFFFTLQTLGRSARHRLYLAGYVLVGCVLSYTAIVSLATVRSAAAGAGPSASALSIQTVLAFFLIVGLRVVLAIPAELRASWMFRLTAGGEVDVRRYLAGVRRAIAVVVVLPFFAALCCVQAVSWGPRIAVLHFACGFLWALVLAELLLLGFTKLPFTCPQVPGKANVKVFGAIYLFAFLTYAYGFADVEHLALQTANGSAALIGSLLMLLGGLAAYRHRVLSRRAGFVFDELPDPALVTLGL